MKNVSLLILLTLLVSCPSPVIKVDPVNAPAITGITSGYFTEDQTFTVVLGYAGNGEYSIDGGDTWETYVEPVTLSNSFARLYEVVARQYNESGKVSGNSETITLYIDTTPATVFTIENLVSGVYLSARTIFIQRTTNAVVEYSLNGGFTYAVLDPASYFIRLEEDGTYDIVIRQKKTNGDLISLSDPVRIVVARNAELLFSNPPGNYLSEVASTVAPPHTSLEVQFQLLSGAWTYWDNEVLSVTSDGVFLGDWSNGSPPKLSENGQPLRYRLRDGEGNLSSVRSAIFSVGAVAPTLVISGVSPGAFNTNQTFSMAGSHPSIQYTLNGGATWANYTSPVSLAGEGTYVVRGRMFNQFGNNVFETSSITIVIDKTAPPSPTAFSIVNSLYFASKVIPISPEPGALVEYSTDGGSTWTTTASTAITVSSVGEYDIRVRQTDSAGNTTQNAGGIKFRIIDDTPRIDTYSNSSSGWQVIVLDDDSIPLALKDDPRYPQLSAEVRSTGHDPGNWNKYNFPTNPLLPGPLPWSGDALFTQYARYKDILGDVGPASSKITRVDTYGPVVSVTMTSTQVDNVPDSASIPTPDTYLDTSTINLGRSDEEGYRITLGVRSGSNDYDNDFSWSSVIKESELTTVGYAWIMSELTRAVDDRPSWEWLTNVRWKVKIRLVDQSDNFVDLGTFVFTMAP